MADVPHKYDLTISDGSTTRGYVLLGEWSRGEDVAVPEKAIHSYSPAFVPRTNTQGNYGDDSEDFFMTFSQKDWSLGGFQRHARASDEDSTRRFWLSTDVSFDAGRVRMGVESASIAAFPTVVAMAKGPADYIALASSTNLYTYDFTSLSDRGAHGVGAAPSAQGITTDGADIYLSAGPNNLRRYVIGGAFSTFSATGADSLAFLNNALYGYRKAQATLVHYSTAGVASTLHTWQGANGTAETSQGAVLLPFGGKLLIFRYVDNSLWIYDGVGVSLVARFPPSFVPSNQSPIAELNGVVFLSGYVTDEVDTTKPVVFYYANGSIGTLWQPADQTGALETNIAAYGRKLAILIGGASVERLMIYDPAFGGVYPAHTGDLSGSSANVHLAGGSLGLLWSLSDDGRAFYDDRTETTTLTSSLIDFDSSLTKFFRGIIVEYDEASDGDGGSVDIAYRVNDLGGSYTTLQAGLTSGTEYSIGSVGSPITGRSISYKVTLNKGTSTLGPVLKRVYVRAAPIVPQRHRGLYNLNCSAPQRGQVVTEDHTGSPIPRSGKAMVDELRSFASSGGLLTITDPFGSFTGVISSLDITQTKANEDPAYVVRLVVREV